LIQKWDFDKAQFSLYFLAYDAADNALDKGKKAFEREGVLELTHNWGTEKPESDWKAHTGNSDPRGFGHVCISVSALEDACARLENLGAKFQKKLADGRMKNIAFVLDPDGYWVELIGQPKLRKDKTDIADYRLNHTMFRIKDPKVSLKFYEETLGMQLVRKSEHPTGKFTNFFLAFPSHEKSLPTREEVEKQKDDGLPFSDHQGILELCWNWGTESDPEFKGYTSGNEEPKGFGHIAISVDDVQAACDRFEEHNVSFKKKPSEGSMKNIAFILDPDGYWIEVVPNKEMTQ